MKHNEEKVTALQCYLEVLSFCEQAKQEQQTIHRKLLEWMKVKHDAREHLKRVLKRGGIAHQGFLYFIDDKGEVARRAIHGQNLELPMMPRVPDPELIYVHCTRCGHIFYDDLVEDEATAALHDCIYCQK